MQEHINLGARSHSDGRIRFIKNGALVLATVLLASAAICWIAANWAGLSHFTKLLGVQVVLVGLVLGAGAAKFLQRPLAADKNRNLRLESHLLALAGVTVGALLALIGQIYQTGAGSWLLFATWAALLLPWLLVQHTIFLCLLFVLVLNTALALYIDVYQGLFGWSWGSWSTAAFTSALLNAVLLALVERFAHRLDDPWRITPRLVAATVMVWLLTAAFMSSGSQSLPLVISVIAWAALALMYWQYTLARADLAIVSMAVLAAFILLVWLLLSWVGSELGLLWAIILLLFALFEGVRRLRRLLRTRSVTHDPWYVSTFRLVALGITALLLMVLLMMVLKIQLETLWIPGLLLCLTGVVFYRGASAGLMQELGMTLATAGLLLCCASFFVLNDQGASIGAYAVVLLAIGLYVPITSKVFRFITALVGAAVFAVLTWPQSGWSSVLFGVGDQYTASLPIYLRVWWFSVLALAVFLAGQGSSANLWRPLAWAFALVAQIVAWGVPPLQWSSFNEQWADVSSLWIIQLASAALPVVILAAMLWRQPTLPASIRVGAPLALAVAALGWMGAPGVSLALLWVILGRLLHQRSLLVFGCAALFIYLSRFYYQLDTSLLEKSAVLAVTGGWLLLAVGVINLLSRFADTRSEQREGEDAVDAPDSKKGTSSDNFYRSYAGVMLGLLVVLVTANYGIYKRERILTHGDRVVLELAPVDPRSLIQGDYMRLNFEVARKVTFALQHMPEPARRYVVAHGSGLLVLRPDTEGVHRLAEVLPSRLDAVPPEIFQLDDALLKFRMRRGAVRIVTDAWFFAEGQAEHFQQARYGEFRVDDEGTGILVNMLDSEFMPLLAQP